MNPPPTIPLFSVSMSDSVMAPLERVLRSGYIGQGKIVDEFEAALAVTLDNPLVLTTNSGTSAIHLALQMCEVRDRYVITTPLTCMATNTPIIANGGKIVWADIDPDAGNISPESVNERLEEHPCRVAAIMVVHWGGNPCDMGTINELAASYGVPVIQDAAHALGSVDQGTKIGSGKLSRFTCFSLQAIKHLTSVDGGILACRDRADYDRAKLLRWYGIDREVRAGDDLRCERDVAECGHKFHMNDVNATIGLENLKLLPGILKRAQDNADFYRQNIPELYHGARHNRYGGLRHPHIHEQDVSANWLFTLRVKHRDDFMRAMASRGVMTSKVHARNDTHTCFQRFRRPLPNLDSFAREMVCIPVGPHVTDEDRQRVVDAINQGW